MWRVAAAAVLSGLCVLPGCGLIEMRGGPDKMAEHLTQGAPPLPQAAPQPPNQPPQVSTPGVSSGELNSSLDAATKKISNENQASNNATQNTITGLGFQVTKLAEKMQGFGGDLAHVETNLTSNVNTKFDALAKLQVDMKNELTASVSASLSSVIDTKLNASLDAKLTATASATALTNAQANTQLKADLEHAIEAKVQAGIGNKMDSLSQEVRAGRDSFVDNTKVANQWVYIILSLCLVIVAVVAFFAWLIVKLQVQRADRAEKHAEKAMDIHAEVVTKALGGLGRNLNA